MTVLAACVVLFCGVALTQPPPASDPESFEALWVAHTRGISKVELSDASLILEVDARGARALAVDEQRQRVWAYAPSMLRAYDFTGRALLAIPVATSDDDDDDDEEEEEEEEEGDADDARARHVALAANRNDGTVWLGVQRVLLHFGATGQLLRSVQLTKPVRALSLDPARSLLWLGIRDAVAVLEAGSGDQLVSLELGRQPKVEDVSVDSSTGEAWIALKHRLARYDATGQRVVETRIPELEHIASDGKGAVWAGADRRLLRIDSAAGVTVEMRPLGRGKKIVDLEASPSDGSVWVAGDGELVHVSAAGSRLARAGFSARRKIRDLALVVDVFAPAIQITAPGEGMALNTNRPTIRVEFSDLGSGIAADTLAFEESGAELQVDCVHAEGTATCIPLNPLPEGAAGLTATIRDLAGNVSTPAQVSFTVDTLAPEITLLSPQDGAITNQPNQTFAGSLGEPATLTLNGVAVPVAPDLSFSFDVVLLDGRSEFVLEATDRAGNSSQVTVALTLIRQASAPRLSVPPGDYAVAQGLVMTVDTPGATIHFTTNGVDPTEADAAVASGGTVLVDQNLTLKARAYAPGLLPSTVTTARYTVGLTKTVKPVTWTNLVNAVAGSIVKVAGGAGWNAGGVSTEAFFSVDGYLEFRAGATTSERMIGLANGDAHQGFADIEYAFAMSAGTLRIYESGVARGEFGSYEPSDLLRVAVDSGVVSYRRNGELLYQSTVVPNYPLLVDSSLFNEGDLISEIVISGALSSTLAESPAFSPPAGIYATPVEVALLSSSPGAVIVFTTDGSEPSATSSLYATPLTISAATTLKAKAFAPGLFASLTSTAPYSFKVAAPVLSLASGVYATDQVVTLSTLTPGATLHYTTDGSDPSVVSPQYSDPIPIGAPTTLRAKAFRPGWIESDVATEVYGFKVAPLVIAPGPGTYRLAQFVTLSTATPGTEIRYTTDGSEPTVTSTLYSSPVSVSTTTTLKAKAFRAGWQDSDTASATYTIESQVSIAGGEAHSLVALPDGSVWAWGANDSGELGDGTTQPRWLPVPIPVPETVARVSAGSFHSLALARSGSVWAWGDGSSGQLGTSDWSSSATPVRVPNVSNGKAVAAGAFHSLLLKEDGTVVSWGLNWFGALGDGTTTSQPTPTAVVDLAAVAGIAAGSYHSLAVLTDGSVMSWGANHGGQLGDGGTSRRSTPGPVPALSGIVAVAGGDCHSLALSSSGTVWFWGCDPAGGSSTLAPTPAAGLAGVVAIATKGYHNLAVTADGSLWAWGANDSGQIGIGTNEPYLVPEPAAVAGVSPVVAIGSGFFHSLAVRADGTIFSWGANGEGQLGLGDTSDRWQPAPVSGTDFGLSLPPPTLSPAGGTFALPVNVAVSCGAADMVVRYRMDGSVPTESDPTVACGGTIVVDHSLVLVVVGVQGARVSTPVSATFSLVEVGSVAAGPRHLLYAGGDGRVWAWGANESGQLGNGTSVAAAEPAPIAIEQVAEVAAGESHSLARRHDGTMWAWGSNARGQLGVVGPNQDLPVAVPGLPQIVAVAAGESHSLALASDGTVWAWGANENGQLGDGTTTDSTTPGQVSGLMGVLRIAAGNAHSLALKSDGTVWAWGRNDRGQLGDGTTTSRQMPAQIGNLSNVVKIATGDEHSLAITQSGELWGWGDSASRQLGPLVEGPQLEPVIVGDIDFGCGEGWCTAPFEDVRLADGGRHHSVGLVRREGSHSLMSWGREGLPQGAFGPVETLLGPDIGRLSVAGANNLAVTDAGDVYYWEQTPSGPTQTVRVLLVGGIVPVQAPTFGLVSGSYRTEIDVKISSATPGATIHYTLDGSVPDTTSPAIASGASVHIDRTATLKAVAIAEGRVPSDVRTASYTLKVLDPVLSPPPGGFDIPVGVTVTVATPNAELSYELDFNPVGPVPNGGTIEITPPVNLRVTASRDGWEPSAAEGTYYLGVQTPVITPTGGHFTEPVTVTVSTGTPGVTLRYTTDGQEPQLHHTVIASGGSLVIDRSMTLRVRGWRDDLTPSEIATAAFNYELPAPTLIAARAGSADGPLYVTGASSVPGAAVRCTTDGSEPKPISSLCDRGIPVDVTTTVKAKAFLMGWDPSQTAQATFGVSANLVQTPTFSLPGGRYQSRRSVLVTTATAGAVVRYTTNGATPTPTDPTVPADGHVVVDRSLTLRARAFLGSDASLVASADYLITGAVVAGKTVVALKADGTVWAWGDNMWGQVGNPAVVASKVTIPTAAGIDSVIQIASGYEHSMALREDGTVWTWGSNAQGQLGTTESAPLGTPVNVGLTDIVAVAARPYSSAALRADGTLWTWGDTFGGQPAEQAVPSQVPEMQCSRLLAGGSPQVGLVCVDPSGEAWRSGSIRGPFARWEAGRGILSVDFDFGVAGDGGRKGFLFRAAGDATHREVQRPWPAAMASDNTVVAHGALPWLDPQIWYQQSEDRLLIEASPTVSVGRSTVVAASGEVWRWGTNQFGELGDGTIAPSYDPFQFRREPQLVPSFQLLSDPWLLEDSDADGLTNAVELDIATDPWNADTNSDGVSDGVSFGIGRDPLSLDLDGDGVSNAAEIATGTDPLNADTDGDGHKDGEDAFPLDPSRWQVDPPDPTDTTPPTIILRQPASAVPISTVP